MFAHGTLTDYLDALPGVDVERGYLGLETAFRATAGAGQPVVAICAEYDALPGIGHACGHNLIAEVCRLCAICDNIPSFAPHQWCGCNPRLIDLTK